MQLFSLRTNFRSGSNLPEDTLPAAVGDLKLLLFIALHAMLIVDGDPNVGIEEDRFLDQEIRGMRMCLVVEHLRRIGFLRARYPRDPFSEVPEIAWWTGHPYVEVLYSLPTDHQQKLTGLLLTTGDLAVLSGYIAVLPDAELNRFLDRAEKIDSHVPKYLKYLEDEYGDSQKLAWSAPMTVGQ